jgi:hypothetical protein
LIGGALRAALALGSSMHLKVPDVCQATKNTGAYRRKLLILERETGFEPATNSLEDTSPGCQSLFLIVTSCSQLTEDKELISLRRVTLDDNRDTRKHRETILRVPYECQENRLAEPSHRPSRAEGAGAPLAGAAA